MPLLERIKTGIPEFFDQARIVSQKTGIKKVRVILSEIWCLLRYGARPIDYVRFEFYKKSHYERNRYLTIYRYFRCIKHFGYGAKGVKDKLAEYYTYKDYVHREWMVLDNNTDPQTIKDFVNNNGAVIAKPIAGDMGKGVMKINNVGSDDFNMLLLDRKNRTYIVEQLIHNCEEISVVNPSSLNTVRATTLILKDGTPEILSMILRAGTPGSHLDNWGAGGVGYNFDIETGICNMYGKDKKNNSYMFHPGSNVQMIGFRLPRYEELKKYVIDLAKVYPEARYVGWDIAITPEGFDLVEMNCPAGHDMFQSFDNPIYDIMLSNW